MVTKYKSFITNLAAVAVGVVNGLLGAGGGMLAVPLLKRSGLSQKESHANAVAVILPISIMSAAVYMYKDYVNLIDALPYLPTGLLGAVLGTKFLSKISAVWLKRIFGALMIYAGIRLLLK